MAPDTPDQTLLRDYVERRSEAAFGMLVRRHMGLVYATCRRETGDPALAEDAALAVFVTLARKAPALHRETGLAGWLFQTARLTARNAARQEGRRRHREQTMSEGMRHEQQDRSADDAQWRVLEPLLNDALARLGPADREAVLLRFFEGLTLADVGRRLGLPENTARMRVARALEKMRRHLAGAGVAVAGAALAALLTDHAALAAPAPCLAAASAVPTLPPAALPAGVGPLLPHFGQGVLKIMSVKIVSTSVAAALIGSLVVGGVIVGANHGHSGPNGPRQPGAPPQMTFSQAQGQALQADRLAARPDYGFLLATQKRGILSIPNHARLVDIQTRLWHGQGMSDADLDFWIELLHKGPLINGPYKWGGFYTLVLSDAAGRKKLTPSQQKKMYDAVLPFVSDAAYAKTMDPADTQLSPSDPTSSHNLRVGNEKIAVELLAQTRDPRALGVLAQIAQNSPSPDLRQWAGSYHDQLATAPAR